MSHSYPETPTPAPSRRDADPTRFGGRLAPVPVLVQHILQRLHAAGYAAHLVGGCVRDRWLGRPPHDWDVATAARPEEVLALFPHSLPTGVTFGTVTVLSADTALATKPTHGDTLAESVEVTTYRQEMGSRDQRHPDRVVFSDSIVADLVRRDFTINALAYDPWTDQLVDPAGGEPDLDRRLIRAVGDPDDRFREDALRPLRAIRLASELRPYRFRIEPRTRSAIRRHAPAISTLSRERVRDELLRLLASPDPQWGLWELEDLGLLYQIIPELAAARDFPQAKPGIPTLLDHLIRTVQHVPPDPILRLTALLHDVAKPATVAISPSGEVHFHGHDEKGAEMAREIGATLRLSRLQVERIASLIRMHMVNGIDVGKKALRRWLGQYGEGWVRDLFALRRADNIASGFSPDEPNPFIDRLEDLLDEVLAERSALRTDELALDGHQVMNELGLQPGPLVGEALTFLLEQVLEEPSRNTSDTLRELLRSWWRRRAPSHPEPPVD